MLAFCGPIFAFGLYSSIVLLKKAKTPEVLLLRDGVVLVIVALGAGDGAPEPDGSGGLDPVQNRRHPVLLMGRSRPRC